MKMKDFQWTRHSKLRLPEIKEIFDQMWCYYDQYLKQAQDLPYWSTEMALVGNLAVAAALKGYPAALEFFNEKGKGKKRYRADLWLGLGKKNNGIVFEAKCGWVSAKTTIKISQVKGYLKKADDYLKKMARNLENPRNTASWSGSLFFAQIYLHARDIKRYEELINNTKDNIHRIPTGEDLSFFAYYFLEKRKIPENLLILENYCCPGICVFGKISKFS